MKTKLLGNKRQSNIELLRIIAMIMIVAHHIAVHSDFTFSAQDISINSLWIRLIELGGKIGVNIFVLISGFFMISSTKENHKKTVKLWLQIFSYSALFFLFAIFALEQDFGVKSLIKSIFPITYSTWWFASAYFVLYLLSPYINRLAQSLNKKSYARLLLILFFCWSLVPTFLTVSWQSNSLLWFVFLYLLAGYIRLHLDINKFKSSKCIICALAIMLLIYLSSVVLKILAMRFSIFEAYTTYFYSMEKLPALFASLFLFVGFLNLKMGYSSIVNIISSATFGVYLIHDNAYIRNALWVDLFKNQAYQSSAFLVPYTILQLVLVFAVCTVIELARIHFIEKHYLGMISGFLELVKKTRDKLASSGVFQKLGKYL